MLKGSEKASLDAAIGFLEGMQKAAEGVLRGSEFVGLETAKGALEIAQFKVKTTGQAVDATMQGISAALDATGGALASVKTSGFLQVSACAAGCARGRAPGVGEEVVSVDGSRACPGLRARRKLTALCAPPPPQLYRFGIEASLRTSRISVALGYSLAIAGNRIDGKLSVSAGNPREVIVGFLEEKVLGEVKNKFAPLAPYL